MRSRFHRSLPGTCGPLALAAILAASTGCVGVGTLGDTPEYEEGAIPVEEEAFDDEEAFEESLDPEYQPKDGLTVGELVSDRGCSTAPTMPLNAQIAEQLNCIEDGFFTRIDDIPNVVLGPSAAPFLQAPAAEALRQAAEAKPGSSLSITNSWRSVVQQYVLYSWEGSCGISVAARPGSSNHESGLAIDVPLDTTTTFRSALRSNGFRWYCDATNGGRSSGCGDRPHHDYSGGGSDLRSRSVLAFQQLWNHAHPEDQIAEDGVYGPATESRIRSTPVAGFAAGTTCEGETGTEGQTCGDGSCGAGEDCASCPGDCGACPPACGDGTCGAGETCEACPADCGACPAGCSVDGHGGSGENGDPCAEEPETWRCVHSAHWDDQISQVCRDGEWVTFELSPRDCEACCGDYSSACSP